MKTSHILSLLSLILLLTTSGCVIALGNSGSDKNVATRGQELIDLKKAKDAGIITEEDYQSQKKTILGRH
ncbi:MAG: hypothetical protein JWM04_2025 [Verrucomicrobiales bacterium]|jgi:uncharacterized membrane protein|nr:hypothetical protein [Verrucomicrobiales bacterium]